MSYRMTAAIAENHTFRARVRACLLKLACDVANEAVAGPATDTTDPAGQSVDASFNRAARHRLAADTLADPSAAAGTFAWLCAANPQIQAAGTFDTATGSLTVDESAGKADDPALEYVCSSNWDSVARWRTAGTATA